MDPIDSAMRLEVTPEGVIHLASIRKWTLFLAIMGFIGSGFLLLTGLFFGLFSKFVPSSDGLGQLPGLLIMVLYVIIAILYLFPSLFLLKFSSRVKQALAQPLPETLAEALQYLRFFFTFFGAMAILAVCVMILGVIAAIGLAVFSHMHGSL